MWKDKDGKKLENEDTVIVEGKISGRHSSDRISVTVAPGQVVLVDAAICRKGKAKPEAKPKEVAPWLGSSAVARASAEAEPEEAAAAAEEVAPEEVEGD